VETKNDKKTKKNSNQNKIKRIDAKGLCATCLTDRSSEIIFFLLENIHNTLSYLSILQILYIHLTFFFTEETILSFILKKFEHEETKYVCVASEIDSIYQKQRVIVQIIFKDKKKRDHFLHELTCK